MPSTSNFDLTYNQQNVVAGGALSNSSTTPTGTGAGGVDQIIAGSNITISPTSGVGTVTISATGGGTGTVSRVDTGTGLTGGPITTIGTVSLATAYAGNGIGTVNGIAKGNGLGAITAATAGTDYVIPSGSITGTASNITATTNSTLTTLSALSLPGSQVSGNIAGNSANVTGTVAITNGGTGATTASSARTNLGLGTVATQAAPSGTSSQLLANNGSGGFSNVSVGSGLSYSGGTLTASSSGGSVTRVDTSGSVNGITLTGGPITTTGTVTLGGTLSGIANSQLTNSSVTVSAGTGLSGGGTVALGGTTTLTNAGVTSLASSGSITLSGSTGNVTIGTTGSTLPTGGTQGQVLLQGASSAGWYNHAYNVTAFASLSAAITAAGSTGVLYFPTAYTIPNGTTISLPIIVEGLLTCSGTAVFNGTIQAPLKQIFSGGTISIGPNTPYIYPEWFGATKTGSSDDQPSISSALSSVTLASGSSAPTQSVVLTGTYYLGGALTLTNSQMFKVVAGASLYPFGSYRGDCIVYQYNSNNTLTDIPTIVGFTSGAGLTFLGCSVIKATGFMIKNCKYGIKIQATSGHPVLDNYVNIHFLPDCQYGVFFTDDGTAATIQGNEIYSNFYTNDNISTNPWVSGGYASGIAACYWDNKNVYNWNGNTVQIKAIDINGAGSSYGFYNASSFSTYGGNSFLNGWQLGCPLWFGGINNVNLTSAYYLVGGFLDSEFRFAIQTPSANAPYNLINTIGNGNRFIFSAGGGAYSLYNPTGAPQSFYAAQGSPNSRSSFANSSSNYCAPFANRIFCSYTISSSIAANAELTLYIYTPITDAYLGSGVYFSASNNYSVLPLANYGLIFETAYDNSLTNANEVVVKFRNVSGAAITSGTFNFMMTVGL